MSKEIKKVLAIGNGAMAQHIGLQCALHGKEVVLYVRNPEKNERVLESLKKVAQTLIDDGLVSEAKVKEGLSRMSVCNDVEKACQGADLVTESVAEEVEAKRATWAKFAPYLPKDAVLTTNTSSLSPSEFADATGAPERFLAWHFHLTVYRQNLADIMPHPGTDPKYVEIMKEVTTSIGQNYCLLKKEYPGYLANSILFVICDKALDLYLDGAANFDDIDKAFMTVRIENSGPFGIMDKIGLDVMMELLPPSPTKGKKLRLFQSMIDEGRLGMKSGKGFYTYPNPKYLEKGFVVRPQKLF